MLPSLDIHVLTIPGREALLKRQLAALQGEPCSVHVILDKKANFPAARIKGLSCGTSEYIGFVDDDDKVCRGAINALLRAVEKNPMAVGAYTDELWVDVLGAEVGRSPSIGKLWSPVAHVGSPFFVHHVWIAKRVAIEPWLSRLSTAGGAIDFCTTCAAALSGPFFHVPQIGYHWVRHSDGHHAQKKYSNFALFRSILKELSRVYPELQKELIKYGY